MHGGEIQVTDQDCEGRRWDPGGMWYCPAGAVLAEHRMGCHV